VRYYDSPYLVYHEKVKTSRVFIRDCSMVSVYPLVLFGGGQITVELHKGEFLISLDDGWIRFVAASHQVGGVTCWVLIGFESCDVWGTFGYV
jgi:ATP-dependent RNA helicase DHX57